MTRVSPRTSFHSSQFIRCLADLAVVDTVESGNAFAEKLGQWIHFADAIALSAVHSNSMASAPAVHATAQDGAAAARAEFGRTQALLANSIMNSFSPGAGKTHISLPAPMLEPAPDPAAAYPPYRRFYEAHQRDMELRIQPLRVNVRATVAKASPRLAKLAELDAVLERILRERESRLLAKVPVILRKRFDQLFTEHRQQLAGSGQADGWLARFCSDMQMLLLAELELRLQPALGLIEAFTQETQ